VAEALTALVSTYLDAVLAAQQEEVENFFSPLIGRARVREAVNALQTARELSFVHVGGRVLMQVSSLQLQAHTVPEAGARSRPRGARPSPPQRGLPLVRRPQRAVPGKSAKPPAGGEKP